MRRSAALVAMLLASWAPASFAHAGIYTDDLARCLVKSTTLDDQNVFIVFMFTSLSLHPAVKAYANVTDAQREAVAKQAAGLFQRLITADCRSQSVAALKYEGAATFESAFNVFGQAAMRGLITDPAVARQMSAMGKYADSAKFEALAKEAGVPPAAKPK